MQEQTNAEQGVLEQLYPMMTCTQNASRGANSRLSLQVEVTGQAQQIKTFDQVHSSQRSLLPG
jgi:hypothetical protein